MPWLVNSFQRTSIDFKNGLVLIIFDIIAAPDDFIPLFYRSICTMHLFKLTN
jgi:hypothetical protein